MIREQYILDLAPELIVDNFAGGGGASMGIEMALGRHVDIAINHDREAVAMHAANHPQTAHYCESVWDVDPVEVCGGRPVGLAHFSPDCKHFSKAKGGKPREKRIRGLAWVVLRWVAKVRPRVIILENVEEFQTWCPLLSDGTPSTWRRQWFFHCFVGALRRRGYAVDWRELRAHDYGAPTIRKRLFLIARCDGRPICWPEPTHGPGTRRPHRTAAECIDWSIPCPSIFGRRRPLAAATMRRIAKGIMRYVVNDPQPFIVPLTHQGAFRGQALDAPLATVTAAHRGEMALVAPVLTEFANATNQRVMPAGAPLRTICAEVKGGHHALVSAFLVKHFTGVIGSDLRDPISTVTAIDHHSLIEAFLIKYYGNEADGVGCNDPMHTVTSRDRFGLVTVYGEKYHIADIGLRMLQPRELYRAQGFPETYIIGDRAGDPLRLSKSAQVRMVGNSVCPPMEAALVRANVPEMAMWDRSDRRITA